MHARLSCALAALLLAAARPAAAQEPVHWRLARATGRGSARPGDRVRLRLTATLDSGWYIYSLTQPAGGPYALRITLPEDGPFRLDGAIAAPDPERHHDPNFGVVETYRGAVAFGIRARRAEARRGDVAVVLVRSQACNDRICLPPHTDSLRLALAPRATPPAARTGVPARP